MRMLRRLLVTLACILALIAMPVVADDDFFDDEEDDVFTQQVVPAAGINKMVIITECGKTLLISLSVFDKSDADAGLVLLVGRPSKDKYAGDPGVFMSATIAAMITAYNPKGLVIETTKLTQSLCV